MYASVRELISFKEQRSSRRAGLCGPLSAEVKTRYYICELCNFIVNSFRSHSACDTPLLNHDAKLVRFSHPYYLFVSYPDTRKKSCKYPYLFVSRS